MGLFTLHLGDCLDVMVGMDANSVDSVICDPPYALTNRVTDVLYCESCGRVMGGRDGKPEQCPRCDGVLTRRRAQTGAGFMGKDWDTGDIAFHPAVWEQVLRVAKPGALLMAFGGTRTFHRLTCAIEDAGWEVRDVMCWLYGSGFPKSHQFHKSMNGHGATWDGWGTALKPAWEPIIVAMKPLDGTFAQNAERWGVAGLNIEGGRIPADKPLAAHHGTNGAAGHTLGNRAEYVPGSAGQFWNISGRWPANLILDEDAAKALDEMSGMSKSNGKPRTNRKSTIGGNGIYRGGVGMPTTEHSDTGGASRFFYCAKASRSEREAGLEGERCIHPTVKPLALMRYLCKLTATPTGGIVLDPFMGSGTTGMAAIMEGRAFIGIEQDADYLEIARRRIAYAEQRTSINWIDDPLPEWAGDAMEYAV